MALVIRYCPQQKYRCLFGLLIDVAQTHLLLESLLRSSFGKQDPRSIMTMVLWRWPFQLFVSAYRSTGKSKNRRCNKARSRLEPSSPAAYGSGVKRIWSRDDPRSTTFSATAPACGQACCAVSPAFNRLYSVSTSCCPGSFHPGSSCGVSPLRI